MFWSHVLFSGEDMTSIITNGLITIREKANQAIQTAVKKPLDVLTVESDGVSNDP